MDPIADQMLAAMEEAGGYSEMASAFHPTLRSRVAALVARPREMPDLALYAEQLPDLLGAVARELMVRVSAESPAPYLVWARYPLLNWPVPACMTIPAVARLLVLRCADRCDWCGREDGDLAGSALLCSAGTAVALFAFCGACRMKLSDDCDADLSWIDVP